MVREGPWRCGAGPFFFCGPLRLVGVALSALDGALPRGWRVVLTDKPYLASLAKVGDWKRWGDAGSLPVQRAQGHASLGARGERGGSRSPTENGAGVRHWDG